jgi:hypothetical protein
MIPRMYRSLLLLHRRKENYLPTKHAVSSRQLQDLLYIILLLHQNEIYVFPLEFSFTVLLSVLHVGCDWFGMITLASSSRTCC